ncbi:MAG: PEP-CTERM sorting domain-containing protein [Cyanophyceae cyanobacterium]
MRLPTSLKSLAAPVGISLTAAAILTAPAHAFTKYSFSGSGLTADGEDWSLDGMFEVDQDTREVRNDVFTLTIGDTDIPVSDDDFFPSLSPFLIFDDATDAIIQAEIFLSDTGVNEFNQYAVSYFLSFNLGDESLFEEEFVIYEIDPEGETQVNGVRASFLVSEFTDDVEQPMYLSLFDETEMPDDGDGGQKVPEPSTMFSLLGLGLGALATKRKLLVSTKN